VDYSERDEMSAISRAVNDLLLEERQWSGGRSDEKIREATLLRLLSGETGQMDEDAKKVLPYSRNVCVMASLGLAPGMERDEVFDSRVKLFIKVIQEELEESGNIAVTAMRHGVNTVTAIVSVGEAVEDLESLMRAKLTALQAASGEILDKPVTFSVGSLQDDLVGVWESFGQARRALEYSYFYGEGSLLFYDEVCGPAAAFDASARISAICQSLRAGKKERVVREIRGLAEDMERHDRMSVGNATEILNRLATELIRYAEESEIRLEDVFENGASIYQQLWNRPYFHDNCKWLEEGFSAVIDYQNASQEVGNEHIRRVMEYVKAHYAEGITIDDIASYIGFSYSYLRKIFKDVTGRNLTDHINELRIKKAKKLLRDTPYTVREIAMQCGYTHERSFSRAFVQAENVSPGKYKEMNSR
jgi:AraC-like DNA-binding protein